MIQEYIVWCPEDSETINEGEIFFALDKEVAATSWAIGRDASGDGTIAAGNSVDVVVQRNVKDAEQFVINVSGEYQRVYHTRSVSPKP